MDPEFSCRRAGRVSKQEDPGLCLAKESLPAVSAFLLVEPPCMVYCNFMKGLWAKRACLENIALNSLVLYCFSVLGNQLGVKLQATRGAAAH